MLLLILAIASTVLFSSRLGDQVKYPTDLLPDPSSISNNIGLKEKLTITELTSGEISGVSGGFRIREIYFPLLGLSVAISCLQVDPTSTLYAQTVSFLYGVSAGVVSCVTKNGQSNFRDVVAEKQLHYTCLKRPFFSVISTKSQKR